MVRARCEDESRGMRMRHSAAAIVQSARSVEASRLARQQTERAISDSLKLLRRPIYPDDQPSQAEQ